MRILVSHLKRPANIYSALSKNPKKRLNGEKNPRINFFKVAMYQSTMKVADVRRVKNLTLFLNFSYLKHFQKHCLWKEILSQQRIRHFKILQSIYFAYDVGIISCYSNRIKNIWKVSTINKTTLM